MEQETILIVEDNSRLRKFMASSLKREGYQVEEASSGKEAYKHLREKLLDLVLLDLKLSDAMGIDILQTIRRQDEHLPVIIVSSINDRTMKVDGFEIGCDDYITKPFYVEELLVRVKRLLKRSAEGNVNPRKSKGIREVIESGPFELDMHSLEVRKNGTPLEMRKKLFELLLFFLQHPDTVFSNEQIHEQVWDSRGGVSENSLYVHIRQLRQLIEDDPSKPRYIKTVRNSGYRYSAGG